METIGFIGLGRMGKPMARNLLRAGYPLIVFNRSRAPMDELAREGARTAESPRAVAAASDIVITMLPDPPTVEQVIVGENGVLEGCRAGMIVMDMSTNHPRVARQLAALGQAREVWMVDAPVSGGEVGAQNASLSIMVGGDASVFERVLPILKCLGTHIVRVGDAGAGQVVKIANQIIVGLTIQAVAEGLVFAARAGADPAQARQAMFGGFASSRVLELHGRRMIERDFVPGGTLAIQHKDLQIALDLAREFGIELPSTQLVDDLIVELLERGFGSEDHAALVRATEARAQLELRSTSKSAAEKGCWSVV